MAIAILGWGSLVWDPRNLPHYGPWMKGGPTLQVEFSRVSIDCRLTLVIDTAAGALCPTRHALSPRVDLADAVEDLRCREGTSRRHIGHFDNRRNESSLTRYPGQVDVIPSLRQWCNDHKIDAVVWTALPPNFKEEIDVPFCVDAGVAFLKGLPKSCRENALKYFRNAPEEVITPLRRRVSQEWPA
jgi:hypothetical protein